MPDTEGVPQLSVAVGNAKLTGTQRPFVDAAVLFVGHVVPKLGAVTSPKQTSCVTVITKEQVLLLFRASVAVYVTVVVPTGKQPPFVKPTVGLVTKAKVGIEQLSVADAAVQVVAAQVVAVTLD